ncbi:MAG: AMP-binding protein [Actinomycetota bacterium]|jgi:long-chain acyl-CoA synthetase|nr:AMP-binding protein [Actinomycetota bacterium]
MGYPGLHAAERPDHPAVIMAGSGETLSYRELDERSNRLAHVFREQGLQRGDHVALFMENQIRYMEVVWAALRSGLYITAVNSYLSAPEVEYILDDCDAQVVVSSRAKGEVAGAIDPATTPKVERWLMTDGVTAGDGGPGWESYEDAVGAAPSSPIADESPGFTMLYSSGTTGRPKGVKRPLPEHDISELDLRTENFLIPFYDYGADMTYLSPAPMYHAAPLAFSNTVHRVGGTLVMMEKFDAGQCLADLDRYSATHSQFVPTMFVRMLKLTESDRLAHDLTQLRVAIHAAAPCPVPVKHQMIDWWGPIIYEYYAGSEGNGATVVTSEEWLERPGTVGRPRAGQLHICDDDGNDLPAGEPGTIFFSGGGVYEYYKAPEKTEEAKLPGGRTTLGDIGYLDEDGYLFLTDRKAHMIISGGVNIYPQEIEDVLITHPKVTDVAVFGVPEPEMGEEVKAVVQLADGIDASAEVESELIAFARDHIAHFKCPRSVDFEDELPRLPTGKLYKRILRDRYWGKTDTTIV